MRSPSAGHREAMEPGHRPDDVARDDEFVVFLARDDLGEPSEARAGGVAHGAADQKLHLDFAGRVAHFFTASGPSCPPPGIGIRSISTRQTQRSQSHTVVRSASRFTRTSMPMPAILFDRDPDRLSVGDAPAALPVGGEAAEPLADPAEQSRHPQLDRRHARRPILAQDQDDAVHFAHLAVALVAHLVVEEIANEVHQVPPKICSGMATIPMTNASTVLNPTTRFENQPLV